MKFGWVAKVVKQNIPKGFVSPPSPPHPPSLISVKQKNLKSNTRATVYSYRHLETFIISWKNNEKETFKKATVQNVSENTRKDIVIVSIIRKILRLTLVFMWNSNYGKIWFQFFNSFLLLFTKYLFWQEDWALDYHFMKSKHFSDDIS